MQLVDTGYSYWVVGDICIGLTRLFVDISHIPPNQASPWKTQRLPFEQQKGRIDIEQLPHRVAGPNANPGFCY